MDTYAQKFANSRRRQPNSFERFILNPGESSRDFIKERKGEMFVGLVFALGVLGIPLVLSMPSVDEANASSTPQPRIVATREPEPFYEPTPELFSIDSFAVSWKEPSKEVCIHPGGVSRTYGLTVLTVDSYTYRPPVVEILVTNEGETPFMLSDVSPVYATSREDSAGRRYSSYRLALSREQVDSIVPMERTKPTILLISIIAPDGSYKALSLTVVWGIPPNEDCPEEPVLRDNYYGGNP